MDLHAGFVDTFEPISGQCSISKLPGNVRKSLVFRWYENCTLARKELIKKPQKNLRQLRGCLIFPLRFSKLQKNSLLSP